MNYAIDIFGRLYKSSEEDKSSKMGLVSVDFFEGFLLQNKPGDLPRLLDKLRPKKPLAPVINIFQQSNFYLIGLKLIQILIKV